jgi:hypothetical protein
MPNSRDDDKNQLTAVRELFLQSLQKPPASGQTATRPVFNRTHGIAHGWFEPLPDADLADLSVGVFGLGRLSAWVRFSSDAFVGPSDLLKNPLGLAIKVFGVPGPKLLGDGDTQDFIFGNSNVFFANDAKEMCEFAVAELSPDPAVVPAFNKAHPRLAQLVKAMQKTESGVLSTTYWSVLPYAFGTGRYVKYKLEPELTDRPTPPDDPNYLAKDLASRMRAGDARFRFLVQFRTDPERMPLDQASVPWDELVSLPVLIGHLVLPRQDVGAPGQPQYGENLSFNAWHCLKEHEPQGSIAQIRKVVYAESAKLRRDFNGAPDNEPGLRRSEAPTPIEDHCIVSAAIFPPIGIARVGNSTEYFLGPEVPNPAARPPGYYRDNDGALKRQAARFRIYGVNALNQPVAELNSSNAHISWTVHLANTKAAWYQFQMPMDIPEAASAPPFLLRNPTVANRADLCIDPGSRTICGKSQGGLPDFVFGSGKFMGTPVYLGELRTDKNGNLAVLGGFGKSASSDGSAPFAFANNERWHDDVSDGPVTARVTWNGKTLFVAGAWVVVAPPDYAPRLKSVCTMWDVMRDTAIAAGMLTGPRRPSFERDIRPIFDRLSGLQWVNAGFAAAFGWRGPLNLSSPEMLERLSAKVPNDRELRRIIANNFRNFGRDAAAPQLWPWLYGDTPMTSSPRSYASLSGTQLRMLAQWADGDFEADYDPQAPPVHCLAGLPPSRQTEMLTRAAMEFCTADAFHPGCEMSWPMRAKSLYDSPFRIKQANSTQTEANYGANLIPGAIPAPWLQGQYPGGLTRWMAVPWQTDTASCGAGLQANYDPYLPTFWPSHVPNNVLTYENYKIVVNKSLPIAERLAAFASRASWMRAVAKVGTLTTMKNMIAHYGDMGVVEERRGPGDPEFPAVIGVESIPTKKHTELEADVAASSSSPFEDE